MYLMRRITSLSTSLTSIHNNYFNYLKQHNFSVVNHYKKLSHQNLHVLSISRTQNKIIKRNVNNLKYRQSLIIWMIKGLRRNILRLNIEKSKFKFIRIKDKIYDVSIYII